MVTNLRALQSYVKVLEFKQTECVQLYYMRSFKKDYNENLKYSELDYACIHGWKNFMTTSASEPA